MKKLFKKITLVLLTVCAVFACAFAISACNVKSNDYVFVIQNSDGSAFVENAGMQICIDDSCFPLPTDYKLDANGKLTLTQAQVNTLCGSDTDVTVFVFHVTYAEGYNSDCAYEVNGVKEYVCKLYK